MFFRFHQLDHVPGISGDEAAVATLLMGVLSGDSVRVREGTENLFNPIHHGLVFLIHAVAEPNPFILRLPPLLFGISCALLPFVLFRRILGCEVAVIATLLVSTLPLHVAYSRLSQSPSLTPLISLVCLYFAMSGDLRIPRNTHPENLPGPARAGRPRSRPDAWAYYLGQSRLHGL